MPPAWPLKSRAWPSLRLLPACASLPDLLLLCPPRVAVLRQHIVRLADKAPGSQHLPEAEEQLVSAPRAPPRRTPVPHLPVGQHCRGDALLRGWAC